MSTCMYFFPDVNIYFICVDFNSINKLQRVGAILYTLFILCCEQFWTYYRPPIKLVK